MWEIIEEYKGLNLNSFPGGNNAYNSSKVKNKGASSPSSYAIGIDLGTTFSCVSVYRNKLTECIANQFGEVLTPSVVFYDPNTTEVSVGKYAEEWGRQAKSNIIYEIKRLMGRRYDDINVQNLIKNCDCNYKIVRGKDDNAEVEVRHNGTLMRKTPEEVSSEILKYLKGAASKYLGFVVTEAVVSVPAHFSNAQRKATKKAAELAGLKVLKLVSEPVAAAIHYSMDKLVTRSKLLVFDLGGGTLDVSVIDVNNEKFEVKGIEGDSFLGGRDFDKKLLEYFITGQLRSFCEEDDPRRYEHLLSIKKQCKKLKISLSVRQEVSIKLDHVGKKADTEFCLKMSRQQFESLCEDLFTRALDLVELCLDELELTEDNIDEVLLVGGSTRIPKINEMLGSYFTSEKLKTNVNPDQAVVLGAGIQAAILKNNCVELEKYKVTNIAPLSLGIGLDGGIMCFIIKKNTSLPTKSEIITTFTSQNNQKSARQAIYEGERINCKFNWLLASLTLYNLPPGRVGDVMFNTVFSLNEDGILEIESSVVSTNNKIKISIRTQEYRLSQKKIKSGLQEAEQNDEEDYLFAELIGYRRKVKKYCYFILYDIIKISDEVQRRIVKNSCEDFLKYIKKVDNISNIAELRDKFETVKQKVDPIINRIISINFNSL